MQFLSYFLRKDKNVISLKGFELLGFIDCKDRPCIGCHNRKYHLIFCWIILEGLNV